jgi:signal transduction histidine kinase
MSALALSTKSSLARPVSPERRAALHLADGLIVAFATAADISDGVRRVAATLRRAGAVAGAEWWAPAERGGSLVLQASEGSRSGRRTAIPIGPAGTLVVVGARSEPAVTEALTGLIPVLRRRWTEERLAQHASLLARRAEALEDFAALVAHELKAPLQAALLADDAASGAAVALQLVDSVLEAVRSDDAPEDSAVPAECLRAALGDLGRSTLRSSATSRSVFRCLRRRCVSCCAICCGTPSRQGQCTFPCGALPLPSGRRSSSTTTASVSTRRATPPESASAYVFASAYLCRAAVSCS